MTQRIFDVENEQDMADLWDILPDDIDTLKGLKGGTTYLFENGKVMDSIGGNVIKINWHDKTEIIRPIKEATEQDIGKLCIFWNIENIYIGKLCHIKDTDTGKYYEMSAPVDGNLTFLHCRRLTKQEIEELC